MYIPATIMTENPAADNGGMGPSQGWTPVRSIKEKIVENGAKVMVPTPEKQRKFIVSFMVKQNTNLSLIHI